ncbi:E3 ubiquitin-protein ligase APD2-like isoform X2 [Cornus florida]|uniref:E3 ubiquitin-protein ligase APD2-like isoform X2 n=1 Tax=Cornus florida TaxID=4283 RepID=UPI002899D495|nr:E3 ubiquitin-protein ligase APD2-like isoform X2 [Cornus florida]
MEQEPDNTPTVPVDSNSNSNSSNSNSIDGPSSSSSQVHDEHQEETTTTTVPYRLRIPILSDVVSNERDDVRSCLILLVTFWFFASMTLILGFYGSVNLTLGPYCSSLIQANPLFVQSIKAQELYKAKDGLMLFGFYEPPSLDVEITWSETHNAFIESSYNKEWQYFLNKGSNVDISYSVNSPSSAPLSLVIAQDKESLVEWIEDPSYPNTTLSWNIIHGNGILHQEISRSRTYYIAVGNLNSEEVEVQLNFTIKGFLYNTTQAYYKCSLNHQLCSLKNFLLKANAVVLTSPGPEQGVPYEYGYVKLSYGPRWITYFVGSGAATVLIIVLFRVCNMFHIIRPDRTGVQAEELGPERAPLLSRKDDDLSSWGSSYDSLSHDEEEPDEWLAVGSLNRKPLKEGESNSNCRRLCIICFDSPRDCFFLPCGHCAACFTCGARIAEEAGTCPICRRTMKKVRKIFSV